MSYTKVKKTGKMRKLNNKKTSQKESGFTLDNLENLAKEKSGLIPKKYRPLVYVLGFLFLSNLFSFIVNVLQILNLI